MFKSAVAIPSLMDTATVASMMKTPVISLTLARKVAGPLCQIWCRTCWNCHDFLTWLSHRVRRCPRQALLGAFPAHLPSSYVKPNLINNITPLTHTMHGPQSMTKYPTSDGRRNGRELPSDVLMAVPYHARAKELQAWTQQLSRGALDENQQMLKLELDARSPTAI
ncbi:hypothetical protein M422DRAFT_249473 [Sphaerobolus stellatus SS14]|uniref:Uncharacterized protein n=1 Tax=Sphaerobolus stellatus (strain SS14) TaxID=990650 RepID=A0A0C9UUK5_SPHS4|nr:hypothetical protein M422DRAFT_249473 [Sphaerobolus stellatus SS14]